MNTCSYTWRGAPDDDGDARTGGRVDVARDTRVDLETRYLLSTENPGGGADVRVEADEFQRDIEATRDSDRMTIRTEVRVRARKSAA